MPGQGRRFRLACGPAGRAARAASRRHPVPCGQPVVTARRSGLYGWAGYGHCPSHSRWYWGATTELPIFPGQRSSSSCIPGWFRRQNSQLWRLL